MADPPVAKPPPLMPPPNDMHREPLQGTIGATEKEIAGWADRFNVTRAQLEEAVSAVGPDAHAVHSYLRGQGGGD